MFASGKKFVTSGENLISAGEFRVYLALSVLWEQFYILIYF